MAACIAARVRTGGVAAGVDFGAAGTATGATDAAACCVGLERSGGGAAGGDFGTTGTGAGTIDAATWGLATATGCDRCATGRDRGGA